MIFGWRRIIKSSVILFLQTEEEQSVLCLTNALPARNVCKFVLKQELIPVGCVLPARYRRGGSVRGGVSLTETPLDRDPFDRDPPGQRPPWTEAETPPPPRGQTDTCENITFANFVCGR